jgi:para-nitrobenzyl esterase
VRPTRVMLAVMRALAALLLIACGGSTAPAGEPPADAGPEIDSCASDVAAKAGTVITDRGAVTGVEAGETWSFRGIPFATAARFRRPEPISCWKGERAAKDWAPKCAQLDADGKPIGSEDCLTLNVWAPKAASAPRPLMVFIHGGGHAVGSAAEQLPDGTYLYDGASLATKGDVVVITIQYRVGPLGWLAHPALAADDPNQSSGMLGHLDQIAALQWVRTNAAKFGGDPAKVTIFGESAGGVSVCSLIASPLAKGLFTGAIMESGGCPGKSRVDAEAHGQKLAAAVGCADAACLRGLSLDKLLTTVPATVVVAGRGGDYTSVVDGYALPSAPLELIAASKHNAVPFIFGSNTDETSRAAPKLETEAEYQAAVRALFPAVADQVLAQYPVSEYTTPRRAYVALTSDVKFVCPLRQVGEAFAKGQPLPTHRYVFGYVAENVSPLLKALGASHGSELLYVFDHLRVSGYVPTARDQAMADRMIKEWSTFARTGVAWTKWERATDPHLRFDVETQIQNGVRTKQCDFWDALFKL